MPALAAVPVAPKTRRNEALSELRRAEILEAATKVFGRKGFEATRAEDIAAAARIAKGTVYLYFKSKEAIYAAAVSNAVRELQKEIAQRSVGAVGFREKLALALHVRLEFWPEHHAVYRLLMTIGRDVKHRRQTNEILRTAQTGFLAIFSEAVAGGEIEPDDFESLAWAALDMVRGASERRMDRLSTTTPQQDAAWITDCILRQVRATGV